DRRSESYGSDLRAEQRALWKRDIEDTVGNGPDVAGKALFRPGGGLLCRIHRDPFTFEDVWSSEVIASSLQERRSALTKGAEDSIDRAERSEEHTSELQSRFDLVCRLLLEKKRYNHGNARPTGRTA